MIYNSIQINGKSYHLDENSLYYEAELYSWKLVKEILKHPEEWNNVRIKGKLAFLPNGKGVQFSKDRLLWGRWTNKNKNLLIAEETTLLGETIVLLSDGSYKVIDRGF